MIFILQVIDCIMLLVVGLMFGSVVGSLDLIEIAHIRLL